MRRQETGGRGGSQASPSMEPSPCHTANPLGPSLPGRGGLSRKHSATKALVLSKSMGGQLALLREGTAGRGADSWAHSPRAKDIAGCGCGHGGRPGGGLWDSGLLMYLPMETSGAGALGLPTNPHDTVWCGVPSQGCPRVGVRAGRWKGLEVHIYYKAGASCMLAAGCAQSPRSGMGSRTRCPQNADGNSYLSHPSSRYLSQASGCIGGMGLALYPALLMAPAQPSEEESEIQVALGPAEWTRCLGSSAGVQQGVGAE